MPICGILAFYVTDWGVVRKTLINISTNNTTANFSEITEITEEILSRLLTVSEPTIDLVRLFITFQHCGDTISLIGVHVP